MSSSTAAVKTESGYITIKIQMQHQRDQLFTIRRDEAFEAAFIGYCTLEGVDFKATRFTHEGRRVQPQDTPDMLQLEEEDVIDAFNECLGGARFHPFFCLDC
ncbi:unnamed protein product [Cuscuta epithymum]|uniref:Rad60/SUMO-like domain-containing protein n=1 Tax=Cuscuta epithymum TaxID=186058 RepID=A0AAV0DMP9_9ASTE|nr:unnamed protein product [Cuscuta epithymum]CAH9145795.1 unnamed protein product [Cuscuta epithymum]